MLCRRRCSLLPVRAFQHLGEQSREPFQGGNADGLIPGITFLLEVRLSSRISLATIRAQMAMGRAQQRQAQQPPSSQQVGPAGVAVHVSRDNQGNDYRE